MSEAVQEVPSQDGPRKQCFVINKVYQLRDKLAEYQESRGVSKDEKYSFITLVTALASHAFSAGALIIHMLVNLLPIVEGFMYFNRFLLDNLITIVETEDRSEQIFKTGIFTIELVVSLFVLFLIITIILVPIFTLINCVMGTVMFLVGYK